MQFSDADLVQRAQQGDVDAVGELYDRHQLRIFRYVRSRIYDNHLAQDLTGEVFVRMVANINQYQDMGVPFSAWLYRIAHNFIINYVQQEQTHQAALTTYTPNGRYDDNPAVIVEKELQLQEIVTALEKIDPIQCEVIILRFLVGLSLKEVAEIVDKSVGAVKSIQYRGLQTLQVLL